MLQSMGLLMCEDFQISRYNGIKTKLKNENFRNPHTRIKL
jgi:hypothetical protein